MLPLMCIAHLVVTTPQFGRSVPNGGRDMVVSTVVARCSGCNPTTKRWTAKRSKRRGIGSQPPAASSPPPTSAAAGIDAVVNEDPSQPNDPEPSAPKTPPKPEPKADASLAGLSTDELLARARKSLDDLDYDNVLPFTGEILRRDDVPLEQRLNAHLFAGSVLAILDDPIEAEKPFRLLLRAHPDFDLPDGTPPKIVAVFRKVQAEEAAILEQVQQALRQELLKTVKITSQLPSSAEGGRPLVLRYTIADPRGAVMRADLHYRKQGEDQFGSVPLERGDSGVWQGAVPGSWTESDTGFRLQYYLSTVDAQGLPLRSDANAEQPAALDILPGTVAAHQPYYQSPWFWGAGGIAAVAVGLGSWFAYSNYTELPAHDVGPFSVR